MNYMITNLNVNEIILYLRKSRKDYEFAHEDIEKTLQRHEKILQEYAEKTFKTPIPEKNIFREVVSGDTIVDRPEMQKVLSLIEEQKYKAVLVLEIERLARGNTIDQGVIAQTFQLTNTLIITPQKIYNLEDEMDRSFFEDGLYQSRKYLLYTKKILARGRLQSVMEGKTVMSSPPFGYTKEKLKNEKGYKLIINPDEAKIVKLIFNKFLYENIGTSNIAHYLNSIGVKGRKSNIWTPAMIRNILTNISIAGKLTWNKRKEISIIIDGQVKKTSPINKNCIIVNGLHEPIIEYDIWLKCQEKLKRLHVQKAPTTIKNPLSGLVHCKMCGRSMFRRPYYKNEKLKIEKPHIDTLYCSLARCKNVGSDLYLVENKIISELRNILKNYKEATKRENITIIKDYNSLIDNLNSDIITLKKQFNKACELLELNVYNINDFNERKNSINSEIEQKNNAIEILKKEQEDDDIEKYKKLIPNMEAVLELYNDNLTPKEKNDLLKTLIKDIKYYKIHKSKFKDPNKINDFSIEIELKI